MIWHYGIGTSSAWKIRSIDSWIIEKLKLFHLPMWMCFLHEWISNKINCFVRTLLSVVSFDKSTLVARHSSFICHFSEDFNRSYWNDSGNEIVITLSQRAKFITWKTENTANGNPEWIWKILISNENFDSIWIHESFKKNVGNLYYRPIDVAPMLAALTKPRNIPSPLLQHTHIRHTSHVNTHWAVCICVPELSASYICVCVCEQLSQQTA